MHSETQTDDVAEERLKELERKNRDLEIATRGKDFYIERLKKSGKYL